MREYALRPDGRGLEEAPPSADGSASSAGDAPGGGAAAAAREFFLPPGFPDSVSPDYLRYAALTFPCHATGALAGALATAALLHGVGLGAAVAAAPGAPPALSAAVKWVAKDGLGAAGRLLVAGRVAARLDAEPRQWRLAAEAAALAGGALDVATALAPPAAFLPLAAAGTALRACGKAVAAPAHQVILQHFALSGNLGAVAAKEEAQEVLAQLLGLSLSVALLQQDALRGEDSAGALAAAWAAVSAVHVALRAAALAGLRFRALNVRRAAAAAAAHAAREPPADWAGRDALNTRDAAAPLPWGAFGGGGGGAPPRIALGVALADACAAAPPAAAAALPALAAALRAERFLLLWRPARGAADAGAAWVVLRERATPRDALRATWLAAHLCASSAAGDSADDAPADVAAQLQAGLSQLAARFAGFEAALAAEGWQLEPLLPQAASTPRLLDDDAAEDAARQRDAAGAGTAA